MKKNIVIILDPAHGADVEGKCSPDGRHREYKWSRERVKSLRNMLLHLGYEVFLTTESENEVGLTRRKNFATQVKYGSRKLFLSLHNNGAGDGTKWLNARGVEAYTTPDVTDADVCADIILRTLKEDFPMIKMRFNKDVYLNRDKEARYTVLMGTGYMGVLIEWLFQDNKEDVEKLLNPEINGQFEVSLVKAIEEINNYFNK